MRSIFLAAAACAFLMATAGTRAEMISEPVPDFPTEPNVLFARAINAGDTATAAKQFAPSAVIIDDSMAPLEPRSFDQWNRERIRRKNYHIELWEIRATGGAIHDTGYDVRAFAVHYDGGNIGDPVIVDKGLLNTTTVKRHGRRVITSMTLTTAVQGGLWDGPSRTYED